MKYLVILVLVLSTTLCQAQAKDNPFVGTWQLVSGEYVNEKNELVDYKTLGINSQKVITKRHFSFVSMANGKFWAAGTGTYKHTSDEYSEQPTMASFAMENGGNYVFKYEMKGEYWHNSRWHGDKRVEYEVWQRID